MVNPRPVQNRAVAVAAVLLCLAVLLDGIGTALHVEYLWRAGGLIAWFAFAAGLFAAFIFIRLRIGWGRSLLLLIALALFIIGRWLRGSAGVPPDPPLLVAELIGAALFTAVVIIPVRQTIRREE